MGRMESTDLFKNYRISFRVTVFVSVPLIRPMTSLKRGLPIAGSRLLMS